MRLLNINEKLDFPLDLDRIRREVEDFDPGLIGFSVVTNQYEHALEIARFLKGIRATPIVCGGVHCTMTPETVAAEDCFDYVCVGEGEGALLDLATRLEAGEPTDAIPNLVLRRDGRTVRNPVRPFVSLDDLPFKDYEIFDFQRLIDAKNGWVGIMASRGCPFRCSYCFNHRMVDIYKRDTGLSGKALNYIRMHPPEEVARELEYLVTNYHNITTFIFDDDIFTIDKDYLRDVCERYARITDIPFVCNAHVRFFDEETADMLKRAGCRMVKFGLESGSPRVRDQIMHRHMNNDDIARAFRAAHGAGLETSAFVMLGMPGETWEDVDQTVELLATIKPSRFRWSIFFPFTNTDAYDMAHDGGHIDFEKMKRMENFMEASCLKFPPELDLRIRRLRRTLPWEVNRRAGLAVDAYSEALDEAEALDTDAWDAAQAETLDRDKAISQRLMDAKKPHYHIKYNEFMAILEPEGDRAPLAAREAAR